MKIIQLPDTLSNQIAAGEVVERPASVVKELLENSIDANSTWIKIDVFEAGLQKIQITDNGDGMSKEDCERAFLRHATSKIRTDTDLFRVQTLGFRGEALASIASVSRLSIQTSRGDQAGTLLNLEGGHLIGKQKSDARKGTNITVKDLFYNTPARLKYMRTIYTELGHITDVLNRLALANPHIRFDATHNGKQLFKTAGTDDLLQVISQVYGMNVAKNMVQVKSETLDFTVEGFISKPEITRATRSYISTMINGRYIKNYGLNQAIIRGYHTLLPIHRSPIVVLLIKMDPILVDVNVHPAKLEVRFSKEKELFLTVEDMIKATFRKMTLIPEVDQPTKQHRPSNQYTLSFNEESNRQQNSKDLVHEQTTPLEHPLQSQSASSDSLELETKEFDDMGYEERGSFETKTKDIIQQSETDSKNDERIPSMYPIGQLQGTYILAQNENGLYMIDQHAAQERIKYESFKTKLGQPINHSQELFLPIMFEFSRQETIFIEQYKEDLEIIGIFLDAFGEQSYAVRSFPTWFPKGYEEEVIREIMAQIIAEEKIDVEAIREEAAILMACKGSIKANHYLTKDDMSQLLIDLRKTTDPFTCPHGRPIIIHYSTYELEKKFKRIM